MGTQVSTNKHFFEIYKTFPLISQIKTVDKIL